MTQTCCPRGGAPVTVTALSPLVPHPRVPVGAPALRSCPVAVPELGALAMPLPAQHSTELALLTPCPPGLGTRPTRRVGKRGRVGERDSMHGWGIGTPRRW